MLLPATTNGANVLVSIVARAGAAFSIQWMRDGVDIDTGPGGLEGPLAGSPTGLPADARKLNLGDAAPDFALPGSDGKSHSLAENRGQRVVVLAWFPKAFTGG